MRQLFFLFFLAAGFSACTANNVTVDDSLGKYFSDEGATGTFGLYDNGRGHFTVYNLPTFKDSAYLPASTFKIVNSLIGLETGRISSERMVIPWDGKVRRPEWDKDLTMEEAFKVSAVPYYQEVARRIGRDTMQHWLDSLGYGSRYGKAVIRPGSIDTFWLDNSVRVTADEQLGLVKRLYFDQLPFRKATTQDIVKRVMLRESTAAYSLSYKTGYGILPNKQALGWIVGWIEENRHVYFFSMNMRLTDDNKAADARLKVFRGIMKKLGFFEGKR